MHIVSAPVTLESPRGRFFSADVARLGGIELLRSMMEHRIPDPPLTRLTDLRVTEVGLGAATMAMPAMPWWQSAARGVFLGVLRGRPVGAVITGPLAEPEAGLAVAEHALGPRHLVLRVANVGLRLAVGAVRLTVLAPAVAFRGTRSDPNNSSLVLRAEVRGRRILMPGDAEIDAQEDLVRSDADLRADVLKVPHHGSA
jgi:hypothetical protein